VQRLHPIFAPEVNLDLDAVTAHLAARGLDTPRLVRAADGARWIAAGGATYRALTWVDGVTLHAARDLRDAFAAGRLAGRFHRALADLDHDFVFVRGNVHDTAAHLARLAAALAVPPGPDPAPGEARALGGDILAAAAALPPLADLPPRCVHGDMKISNIRFDPRPGAARCFVDLDTLGRQRIAYELGDALRSWCNPAGEDVVAPRFDRDLFAAAVRGYADGAAGLLSPAEVGQLVAGVETVCVELAARFCVDVFEDRYFGWDATRHPSRRAHNLLRARGQLALARQVAAARAELERLVGELLG
jgi:Ser/Thr protein kinase RdoA (MazF antagonist)